MPAPIHVLSESVINRIAAGEVVERPVSVVKELIENAIDAEADSIRVDIETGGKKLIRVQDNGTGMGHDDAFLALERHATSKLHTEKDLVGISTMGFRGEALASIAAVSRLTLMTADGIDPAGTRIVIEGGVLRKSERIGMGRGTVIEVRNLFLNVPVRRKFLKGPGLEAGYVQELLTNFSLAFPNIAFTYTEDGKVKIDAPPVKTMLERISTLYSKDLRDNLIQVEHAAGGARLYGFVSRPPYARSTMRSVQTFVNSRSVRDRLINSAVTRAFSNLVERGRYPLAILFLEVPRDEVDVNVHPQKSEVRFTQPQQIYGLILDGVYKALTGAPFDQPRLPREPIFPTSPTTPVFRHLQDERPTIGPARAHAALSSNEEGLVVARSASTLPEPQPTERHGRFGSLEIVGAIPGSFLVLHDETDLIIMDHHAAHERVLFEDLIRANQTGEGFETQDLLIPVVLELKALEARALEAHLDLLRQAGFGIEEFGESDFVVKGVPTWLGSADINEFFQELVDVLLDTGLKGDPQRQKEELLKSMACRSAVKETTEMHPQEIRALLKDLDRVGSIEVCPHGRPITVRFALNEIRRKMGRR
jgi:DNA mismatch repair protein MutL